MSARYTGREKRVGDDLDNLAGPQPWFWDTLEGRLQLALSNLARVGVGDLALREWLQTSEPGRSEEKWRREVVEALDGLGPDAIWQDKWLALSHIKTGMMHERIGYDPS